MLVALFTLLGCPTPRDAEDPTEWFDPGVQLDVEESIAFTDENYDFSGGIGDLLSDVFPTDNDLAFAPEDSFPAGVDCPAGEDADLPMVIEGVVTVHPRYYFKTAGCDGDEKYYGSFFIQDADGGLFTLGDTKVAHFTVGDRIKLNVRGASTRFDLDMIYSWDLVEIVSSDNPIYYETALAPLDAGDVGLVRRVTGVVTTEKDTFGEFQVEDDLGQAYVVQLDAELNRRGLDFPVGTRIEATGPVLYSFSAYSIVIMNVGQVKILD